MINNEGIIGDPGLEYYLCDYYSRERLIESVRVFISVAEQEQLRDLHGNVCYNIPSYGIKQIQKLIGEYETQLAHNID